MHTPTIMAVHAHPDDECFGGGGTMMHYADQGFTTVLVTCTNGEEGEIVDPTMDKEQVQPRLARVRLEELRQAVAILRITHLELLGYRDSGMIDTSANEDPRSFNKANFEEATERLVTLIRRYQPDVLFTYDEKGGYGHPDHIMAHKITVAAFDAAGDAHRFPQAGTPWTPKKLYYSIFMLRSQVQALWHAMRERNLPTWGDPDATEPPEWGALDEEVAALLDVRDFMSRKIEALLVHRTQIKPDEGFMTLPGDLLQQCFGIETYIRAQSRVAAPDREDDLFAGLYEPALARE
jgi:mycothiol conjugate amidase Mca